MLSLPEPGPQQVKELGDRNESRGVVIPEPVEPLSKKTSSHLKSESRIENRTKGSRIACHESKRLMLCCLQEPHVKSAILPLARSK